MRTLSSYTFIGKYVFSRFIQGQVRKTPNILLVRYTVLCTFREEKALFISISLSVRERKRPPRLVSLVCPSPRRRRRKRDALNDWRKRRRRREGDA